MKVTSKKIDDLNLVLTIKISAEDYAEINRKKLAEKRRNAEFKGFRKGNVPASLIEKFYGEQTLVESVNKLIGDELDSYIKSKKLNILGEPMASDKQPENEWKAGNDFTFVFDLGLSPEINLEVVKEDTVNKYEITPSAETKKKMVESMTKYYTETKKEEKSAEEIEKEVDEQIKSSLKQEAEYRLTKDIRHYFVEKAAITLPEAFLKRWLKYANEGKVTDEQIEKEFDGFIADFKWQLVRGFLMKKYGFEVTSDDLYAAAEGYVRYQYMMYGMSEVPEDMIKETATRILQDGKQLGNLQESVEDNKVMTKLKEEITIKSKKITENKFNELA